MALSHVIVGHILKLNPSQDPLTEGLEELVDGHLQVQFADGEIARISPSDPSFERRRHVLRRIHAAGLRAYVEVEPESRDLQTLRIPTAGRIHRLVREPSGDVILDIDNSAKPYFLPRTHARYEDYLLLLTAAQVERGKVLVTENDRTGELIDIRRAAPQPLEEAALAPAESPLLPISRLPVVRPVGAGDIARMFDLVAARTCDPASATNVCIPFRYPDNGCHARAHKMCRLITAAGFEPLKVWNFSTDPTKPLVVQTSNAPNCQVKGSYPKSVINVRREAAAGRSSDRWLR